MVRVTRWPDADSSPRWAFLCPGCMAHLHAELAAGRLEGIGPAEDEQFVRRMSRHYVSGRIHSFDGNLERPTFNPSVMTTNGVAGYVCHSFVRDGRIEYLGDCTHTFAGRTVELPAWEGGEG